MNILKVRIESGQELMERLEKVCLQHGIRNGAIISLIGAIDSCRIHNMHHTDPHTPVINDYKEPMELSGTGAIVDGKPHIHCVLSREGDAALAGHLHWAQVHAWFVDVYIATLP